MRSWSRLPAIRPAVSAASSIASAISATAMAWSARALGNSAGEHVAVAGGLDLFEPVPGSEIVEPTEDVRQQRNRLLGRAPGCERGEIDEVGKKNGRVGDMVGDHRLAPPHTLDDRARQDVEE